MAGTEVIAGTGATEVLVAVQAGLRVDLVARRAVLAVDLVAPRTVSVADSADLLAEIWATEAVDLAP